MVTKIEHANITVPDIDDAIRFLKIVAPDFKVRKNANPTDSYRWVHIGNEECYFALQEPHLDGNPKNQPQTYINYGINHMALIVSDIQTIEKKLTDCDFKKGIETPKEKYRKRVYYYDKAGFEWELVEYFSNILGEKYLYE